MHIDYLARHPQHLPTLAEWHHGEWGYLHPGETVQERLERLRGQAQKEGIPLVVVALDDSSVLGSASLVQHDMETHPEWSPWLASVFVAPSFRGQGIGTALVGRITDEARRQGFGVLYLFTPDRASFYERLGWKAISRESYHDASVTVMRAKM